MPRYSRKDVEFFKNIDSRYADQFGQLDPGTQRAIINGLTRIAKDTQVPKQDREIAGERARRLKKLIK